MHVLSGTRQLTYQQSDMVVVLLSAGESLSDLDEMKARSASFAAALAEAEAIAAGVEAAFEAARQQAGAPAEEASGRWD